MSSGSAPSMRHATLLAARRVDPDRLCRVALPGQVTVFEAGVGGSVAEPAFEHLRGPPELGGVAEVDRDRRSRGAGVGPPVVRPGLLRADQRVALEVLGEQPTQPGPEGPVVERRVERRQGDQVGGDDVGRDPPGERQGPPADFGSDDRPEVGHHGVAIGGRVRPGVDQRLGEHDDVVVRVLVRQVGRAVVRIGRLLHRLPGGAGRRQARDLGGGRDQVGSAGGIGGGDCAEPGVLEDRPEAGQERRG